MHCIHVHDDLTAKYCQISVSHKEEMMIFFANGKY